MVYFQHHSLRPGSELFSFSRTSSIWSGALNHSTKEYTTGVMCFWPILAIRLNQMHKAGKILELLLRQYKKMSAPIISSGIFDDRYDVLKVSTGSPLHASELHLWKCENHMRIK